MEIRELSNTQLNVKEADSKNYSDKLVEIEEVENTPFRTVKKDEGWFLALGQHRLTDYRETKEEILEIVKNKDWNLMTTVIATIIETINKNNNN